MADIKVINYSHNTNQRVFWTQHIKLMWYFCRLKRLLLTVHVQGRGTSSGTLTAFPAWNCKLHCYLFLVLALPYSEVVGNTTKPFKHMWTDHDDLSFKGCVSLQKFELGVTYHSLRTEEIADSRWLLQYTGRYKVWRIQIPSGDTL